MKRDSSDDLTVEIKDFLVFLSNYKFSLLSIPIIFFLIAYIYLKVCVSDMYMSGATLSIVNPSESRAKSLTSGLGQLGQLAGINIDSSSSLSLVQATLESRSFFDLLLNDADFKDSMLQTIYEDSLFSREYKNSEIEKKIAHKTFLDRINIQSDLGENIVYMTFEHSSNEFSFYVVTVLIDALNNVMRKRELQDALMSLSVLEKKVEGVNQPIIQESLYALIEEKMQIVVLAESTTEYALKIIDPPIVEPIPVGPKRLILSSVFSLSAFAFALVLLAVRYFFKE